MDYEDLKHVFHAARFEVLARSATEIIPDNFGKTCQDKGTLSLI